MPDVVLPVLDEARAIPWVLERLPPGFRPIVVDNGSTDGSGEVAAALGARVVREPRRGFGAACNAGLLAASAPVVCFMDCDASLDPRDLVELVGALHRGADLVLGARRPVRARAWPAHARAANAALTRRVRRRSEVTLQDIGPMRVAHRTKLMDLDLRDRRFGWPLEMVVRAAAAGWRIEERPVAYHPRIGRSKVTGTVRGTARTIRDMRRVLA
jgi:glycosyltransferase involved in cell wall biosynthesis